MSVEPKMSGGKQRVSRDGRPVWKLRHSLNGTRHETTASGTRKEALAYEARWRVELERSAGAPKPQPGSAPVSLFDFSRGAYAEHAMTHLRPKTWEIRRYKLAALCAVLGDVFLTKLTTEQIERYKLARLGQGRSPSTINGELAALSAILTYARDIKRPCAEPRIKLLTERGKGRVKAWTREQVRALLSTVEAEAMDIYPLVLMLAYTGCRKGEGLATETSWIDLETDTLRIEPNADWQPKSGQSREVPIEPALRPWLVEAAKSGRRYAFVSRDGDRWACFPRLAFDHSRNVAGQCEACRTADEKRLKAWSAAHPKATRTDQPPPVGLTRCKSCPLQAQLKGSPHKLRHTYASLFLAGGGSMFALSRILGHASIRTSEKVYSHMIPEALDGARGRVSFGESIGPARMEARKRWAR